jgi:hypothetical protein
VWHLPGKLHPRRCHGHGMLSRGLQGMLRSSLGKRSVPSAATSSPRPSGHPARPTGRSTCFRRDVAMLNNEVTFLEREGLPAAKPPKGCPRRPPAPGLHPGLATLLATQTGGLLAHTKVQPRPATGRVGKPGDHAGGTAATDTHGRQGPLRVARLRTHPTDTGAPELVDLFGDTTDTDTDSDSDSDSDVEVREVVRQNESLSPLAEPTAPRRQRGPCRCTLCNQIGHQRNNRRFHPINTLTN